jgi:hypothetical protein
MARRTKEEVLPLDAVITIEDEIDLYSKTSRYGQWALISDPASNVNLCTVSTTCSITRT